jgi:hypothetical protein
MARPPRMIVPGLDSQVEDSAFSEVEAYPPPANPSPPEPELGDVAELADSRYTEFSWSIYRLRGNDEISRNPQAGPRALVTKRVGPIDILEIQREFGGGIFEFWAYLDENDGRGKRLKFRRVYAVDGPRKDVIQSVTQSAPATAADPQLAAVLSGMLRTLDRLDARASVAPAPTSPAPTMQPFPFAELVQLSKLISDKATPALAGASITEMMGLVTQGIELGKSTQPGAEQSTVAVVLEKLAPSLERLAATLLSRRPAPPPQRRPAGGPVASTAQVVNEPEPAPGPSDDETRMAAAVDSLARAVIEQTPTDDFAFVLEHSLSREQVAMLRLGSTDQIMGQLSESGALAKYPILATEAAAPYLDSVLAELRAPADDETGQ